MNKVPLEFLQIVENDIRNIEKILSHATHDEDALKTLHMELDGKYQACVKDWGKSMYGFADKFGFNYEFLGDTSLLHNLSLMKAKLNTYRFQVNAISGVMPPSTNVTVNVDNNIKISITFDQARRQIEDMTSLTADQTQEALDRVNEIEKVMSSSDSKKTKWEKIKPVLKWLADKSVDVGKVLLPLLLKVSE